MSDSRKRFEEWAKERGLQYDAQNVSRYEGWSARDSEVERLREDAARYRWLRQYGFSIFCDLFNEDAPSLGTLEANAKRLDGSIDARLSLLSSQDKESA